MSAQASISRNLVLKWRQAEQEEAFLADNRMRCSAAYLPLLGQGRGQKCLLYIPKKGVPKRKDLDAHFVAEAILAYIETDPLDYKRLILHLANLTPFSFPAPRNINGYFLDTGESQGRRDYSREQHSVRTIEKKYLEDILYFAASGTLIGSNSAYTAPSQPELQATYTGFGDPPEPLSDAPLYDERLARIRSQQVQKETLIMDQGRCVLSGHKIAFRGKWIGVQVVHLWPLGFGGLDKMSNTAVMHVVLHQLYDQFAFTLTDDFKVIWAHDADPERLAPGLAVGQQALFLRPPSLMPDLTNIRWHRQRLFDQQKLASPKS